MASILISRRIIAGFKHFLAPSREVKRIPNLQAPLINLSIVRSAQRAAELAPPSAQKLDRVLYRIDTEIRRTGRISIKEIDDVFGELKYLKYVSSTQSLLLLRCLGSLLTEELPEVRNQLVQEIWDTLIKFNIPLDISHYNTLLRVYIENERKFAPVEFLSSLEKAGIEPNRVTYQRLITRYCHEGDIDGASKILEFMKEKQLPVNENVFNSLVLGHARADDMESAHGVLTVMKASGLLPSQDTYMNLMIGYAEKGDIEGLDKVVEECQSSDIQLQNHEYMEVIYSLAAKGHSQHVSLYIEQLEKVFGYQQDMMNLIYRLINAGCDEVAYQILKTMSVHQNSDGHTAPVGTFFLRQLIKSELYSVVTVVQYCQKMKREGLNMYSLERALQAALTVQRPELAVAITKVIMEEGAPVRPHYFWPVFAHFANQGEKEKVYNTIAEMGQMEVPITLETCRDYVMPALLEKDKDEESVIAALKKSGMSFHNAVIGCVAYYLGDSDIVSAAQLLSRYTVKLPNVMRRDVADAYIKTLDARAAAIILRQMVNDIQRKEEASAETAEAGEEDQGDAVTGRATQDVAGMFLMDVLMMTHFNVLHLEPVLQAMKTQGISIGQDNAKALQARLGERSTENVIDLLDELSSGDLTPLPLFRDIKAVTQQTIDELEQSLTELEIKNLPRLFVLNQLCNSYARSKNFEKVEEMKQKLDAMEAPYTVGLYVQFIEMHVSEGQLEKALDIYKDLRSKNPEVKINPFKLMRLAGLMMSNGMLEEVVKLFEDNAPDSQVVKDDPATIFACANFLSNIISQADVTPAVVQRLTDLLIELNYAKVAASVYGSLVRVHLVNDDLVSAMEAFEKISEEHCMTPMKHELTLACIKQEDTEKLQRIMDKSIVVHGEVNSLYDFVFAFIECGKVRQAKKILETPGLRAPFQRLESRCKRLVEEQRITELENLVAVTKDVFNVDRNMMFTYLLEAYRHLGDCDKAVGIWTTMQEENVQPSESFLLELGRFLTEHGREVPFAMPKVPSPPPRTPTVHTTPKPPVILAPKVEAAVTKTPFLQALKDKNFDAALDTKKRLENSGVQFSITNNSDLIEGFVQEKKLEEAAKIAREMVAAGFTPYSRVFKFLLNGLSQKGDVETVVFFNEHLNENTKRNLSLNNRICNAYMNAGRTEEFLNDLSSLVDGPEVDVEHVKSKIPAGGIMGILKWENEFMPNVKAIAEKFASHGISEPANCVWMHLFTEGAHEEAKEIYDKHLANSGDSFMFGNITSRARNANNPDLLPPLLEVLNSRGSTVQLAKGIVYSCWLDILSAKQMYDEALGVLEGSLKSIDLQDYNTTALNRVKKGLALSNKTFPYTIPKRVKQNKQPISSSSSSSSSSSDSDKENDKKK